MTQTAMDIDARPLPTGWKWVKLGDVCDIHGGTQPPKSEFINIPKVGYVRLLQIRDFESDDNIVFIPNKKNLNFCNEDDVLVGRYGASVGKVLRGKSGALNVAIVKTIPQEKKLQKDFLYYLLNADYFQTKLLSSSSRAAQSGFDRTGILGISIPLPPLEEQKRITAVLNEQMAAVEKAKKAAEERLEAAEALSAALIEESLQTGPMSVIRLGDAITEVVHGVGAEWSKYTLYAVTKEGLGISTYDVGELAERYKLLEPGTIFYSMRINIGSIALVEEDVPSGIGSPDAVVFKCIPETLHWRWFYRWMRSSHGKNLVAQKLTGSVRERLKFNDLANTHIEVPNWSTQVETATKLKAQGQLKLTLEGEMEALNALPPILIRKAFSGEL